MPAETLHNQSGRNDANKPGFRVIDHRGNSTSEEWVEYKNPLNGRSDKYNSPGVDPDNPYNAFAPTTEVGTSNKERPSSSLETQGDVLEVVTGDVDKLTAENAQLRAELEALKSQVSGYESRLSQLENADDSLQRADRQPRRVRNQGDKTERLVKYINSEGDESYIWRSVDDKDSVATGKTAEEANGTTSSADNLKASAGNKSEDSRDETAEYGTANTDGAEVAGGDERRGGPGKEVELYRKPGAPGKELEVFRPESDIVEKEGDEADNELTGARHAYAEATAKRRGGLLGNLLNNSEKLQYIPFIKKMADKWNSSVDAKTLGPHREAYRAAVKAEQQRAYDAIIAALGDTEEGQFQARAVATNLALQSDRLLETDIAGRRMENSGIASRFINWWVDKGNPDSKLRKLRHQAAKAGVLAAGGLTAGAMMALGGLPLAVAAPGSIAIGGVIGGGIGRHISRKRASGIENKADGVTIADMHRAEDVDYKERATLDAIADGASSDQLADTLIGVTENRTGEEEVGNRRRVGTGAIIGAAAGGAGVAVGAALRAGIENATSQPVEQPKTPEPKTPEPDKDLYGQVPSPDTSHAPEKGAIIGNNFNVESGNGLTTELQQFAQTNGHALSDVQSFQLHQALTNQFGQDYIHLAGRSQDVYSMGPSEYSVGIAAPGQANWDPGVADFVKDWMSQRGLWQ